MVVKQPGGTETTLDGPTFVLDLTPPDVAVTQGARSNNHVENLAAYADGVTIGGTGEIGAKIEVKVGVTRTTTVDPQNGNWSVNYSQSQVAGGERSAADQRQRRPMRWATGPSSATGWTSTPFRTPSASTR